MRPGDDYSDGFYDVVRPSSFVTGEYITQIQGCDFLPHVEEKTPQHYIDQARVDSTAEDVCNAIDRIRASRSPGWRHRPSEPLGFAWGVLPRKSLDDKVE